ncbi:MAG: DUF3606 domain-containing protein [Sphingobacteriales bacterium]|nr:MAG: DUF3606 domain-containing protein [Sphingobacteriales bacterium]
MYPQSTNNWPKDVTRIDLKNEAELQYWEERFHTSASIIREAINEVGPATIAVDYYFRQHQGIMAA